MSDNKFIIHEQIDALEPTFFKPTFNPYHQFNAPIEVQKKVYFDRMYDAKNQDSQVLTDVLKTVITKVDENVQEGESQKQVYQLPAEQLYNRMRASKQCEDAGHRFDQGLQPEHVRYFDFARKNGDKKEIFPTFQQFINFSKQIEQGSEVHSQTEETGQKLYPITLTLHNAHQMLGLLANDALANKNQNFSIRVSLHQTVLTSDYERPSLLPKPKSFLLQKQVGAEIRLPLDWILQNNIIDFSAELQHGSYYVQFQSFIDCQMVSQVNFPMAIGRQVVHDQSTVEEVLVNFEFNAEHTKTVYHQCLLIVSLADTMKPTGLFFFRNSGNIQFTIPFHPFVQQFKVNNQRIVLPHTRLLMAVVNSQGHIQDFCIYPERKVRQIVELVSFDDISNSSLHSQDSKAVMNSHLVNIDIYGNFSLGSTIVFAFIMSETKQFDKDVATIKDDNEIEFQHGQKSVIDENYSQILKKQLVGSEQVTMFGTLALCIDEVATRGPQLYKCNLFHGFPFFKPVDQKAKDVCDCDDEITYQALPSLFIDSKQKLSVYLPVQLDANNMVSQGYSNIHLPMISQIILGNQIDESQISLLEQSVSLLNSHTVNNQMVKQIQDDLIRDLGTMDDVTFKGNCKIIKTVQLLMLSIVSNSSLLKDIISSKQENKFYYKFVALFSLIPDSLAGQLANSHLNDIRAILLTVSSRFQFDQNNIISGSVFNVIGFESLLTSIDNMIVQSKSIVQSVYQLYAQFPEKLSKIVQLFYDDIEYFLNDYQNKSYLKHNYIFGKEQLDQQFNCLLQPSQYGILFDVAAQILSKKDPTIQQLYINKYLSNSIIVMKLLSMLVKISPKLFLQISSSEIFNRQDNNNQVTKIFYIICFIVRCFSGVGFVLKDDSIFSAFSNFYPRLIDCQIEIQFILQDIALLCYNIDSVVSSINIFMEDQFIQQTIQSCAYSNLVFQNQFEQSAFLMIRQIFSSIQQLGSYANKDQFLPMLLKLCIKVCQQQQQVVGFVSLFNTISLGASQSAEFDFVYEQFLPIFLKSSLSLLLDSETTSEQANDIYQQFILLKPFKIKTEVMGSVAPLIDYDNNFRSYISVAFLLSFKQVSNENYIVILDRLNLFMSNYSISNSIICNDLQLFISMIDNFYNTIINLFQEGDNQYGILQNLVPKFIEFSSKCSVIISVQPLIFHHLVDLCFRMMESQFHEITVKLLADFLQTIVITNQMKSTFILLLSSTLPFTTKKTAKSFILFIKYLNKDLLNITQQYLSIFFKLQLCYPLIQLLFGNVDQINDKVNKYFSFTTFNGSTSVQQSKQSFNPLSNIVLNTNPLLFVLVNQILVPLLWEFFDLLKQFQDPRCHWILDCLFVLLFLQNDKQSVDILDMKTKLIEQNIPDLFTTLLLIINQRSQLLINNDISNVTSHPTDQFSFPNYYIQNGATTIRQLFMNFNSSMRHHGNLLFDDLKSINDFYSKLYPHLRFLGNSDFETSTNDFYDYQASHYAITKGTLLFIEDLVKSLPGTLISLRSGNLFMTLENIDDLPNHQISVNMSNFVFKTTFVFKDSRGRIINDEQALDSRSMIPSLLGRVVNIIPQKNCVDDFGITFRYFYDHIPGIDCTNRFKAQCTEKVEKIQTFPTLTYQDLVYSKQSLSFGLVVVLQSIKCVLQNYSNYSIFQKNFVDPMIRCQTQSQLLTALFPTLVPQFKRHIVFSKIIRHTYVDREFVFGNYCRQYVVGILFENNWIYYRLAFPDYSVFHVELSSFIERLIQELFQTTGLQYTAAPLIKGVAMLTDNYCLQLLGADRCSSYLQKIDLNSISIRKLSSIELVKQAQIIYQYFGIHIFELREFLDKYRSQNNKNTELIKRTILILEQFALVQQSSIAMENIVNQNISEAITSYIEDPDSFKPSNPVSEKQALDTLILDLKKQLKRVLQGISIIIDTTHDQSLVNSYTRASFADVMVKLQDIYESGEKGIFEEPNDEQFLSFLAQKKADSKPKKPVKGKH